MQNRVQAYASQRVLHKYHAEAVGTAPFPFEYRYQLDAETASLDHLLAIEAEECSCHPLPIVNKSVRFCPS